MYRTGKKKIGVSFFFFWLGHLRVRTKQDGFPFLYNLLIYIYVVRDKCEIFDLCRVQWVHARHNKKKNRAVVMRTQYVENVWEGVFARCPTFIKKKVMCVCVLSRMRVSKVDVCTYR